MKILIWNVNGLRATLKKGAWDWIMDQSPDVICLQEIKARPDQVSRDQLWGLERYEAVWNPAGRPGYSGVATFTRVPSTGFQIGLGEPDFDGEGRLIRTDFEGFSLFNVYLPNGGRDHGRVPFKLGYYAHLLEVCDQFHSQGRHLILGGDFNTAHREIDLKHPLQNRNTSGFLPEERAWIDTYLEHGFVDVYRARYPERVAYTWWTYRQNARKRDIGWRLDYFLVSLGLVDRVMEVEIHTHVLGSDHCPVTLTLDL